MTFAAVATVVARQYSPHLKLGFTSAHANRLSNKMILRLVLATLAACSVASNSNPKDWTALRDELVTDMAYPKLILQANHATEASAKTGDEIDKVHTGRATESEQSVRTRLTSLKTAATAPASLRASRPVVCAAVNPSSWLAYEFPMGITRDCRKSQCRVNYDQHRATATSTLFASTSNESATLNACDATVYLTSYTPDEVVLPALLRNHVNALVFMENDPRYIRGARQIVLLCPRALLNYRTQF